MTNFNMTLTEWLKISALPSDKIDKYKYLTGEEILLTKRADRRHQIFSFSTWKSI